MMQRHRERLYTFIGGNPIAQNRSGWSAESYERAVTHGKAWQNANNKFQITLLRKV